MKTILEDGAIQGSRTLAHFRLKILLAVKCFWRSKLETRNRIWIMLKASHQEELRIILTTLTQMLTLMEQTTINRAAKGY